MHPRLELVTGLSMDEPSDASLVDRVQSGSGDAIELLFHRHGALVYRVACSITSSADDAEDVVQDVFVELPHLLRRYKESGAFVAWLRMIAARKAIDRLRSDRRRNTRALQHNLITTSADDTNGIALRDAVVDLPTRLRRVFILRAVHGYSHSEIASMLGIRRNASEVRYFRAVQLLRKVLAP